MQKFKLKENYEISRVIKGGWQLSEGHSEVSKKTAIDDMFKYVGAGITTFDCADIYTGVEEMIGNFLVEYRSKFGEEKSKQIKIHTKFVPDYDALGNVDRKYVELIIRRSIERLKVDSLDLVQFHWWNYDIEGSLNTLQILQTLQTEGFIKNIGLTNFNTDNVKLFVENNIEIITNQVQYSLIDRRAEKQMIPYCKENSIYLLTYGTVAGGFLSNKYLGMPEPEEPYENRSLRKYKLIIDDFGGWNLFQSLLECLEKIAKKHNTDISSVASKYILGKTQVAGIIVGVRNADHINSHSNLFNFDLNENDRKEIQKILDQSNDLHGDCFDLERNKESKHGSIMKYNNNKEK